jgi:signal transduction histidine kinase
MKTQFVSDVSHELRTPLTNLNLYLDLLSRENDDAKRHNYLATLNRETKRLTHLIEELLTIARLEADRISIRSQAVDLVELISNLTSDRTPMATKRGLNIKFVPGKNLPPAIADPQLLTQVLSNLLTNALNYTPKGSITLRAALIQNANDKWIVIAITDTGVGITQEEMPHIFERFYRGTAGRKTGSSGTGLGLAISQEIITRMGGRITVHSQPSKGSTFAVWLRAML